MSFQKEIFWMISMSNFGSNGRFGNQLFQYCFLYSMAKKLGLYFFIPKIDLFNRYFDINRLSYVDINLLPKIKTVNHIEKSEFIYNKFNIESYTINNFSGYFQCFDYIYSETHGQFALREHIKESFIS